MPRLTCLARIVVSVAPFMTVMIAAIAFTIASASSVTCAQDSGISEGQRAAGEALLASGKAAYRAGNYSEALRSFQQALARLGRPAIYEDIGDAAAKYGDHQRALDAYREYLGAISNASDRAEVERKIKTQQEALAEAGGGTKAPDLSPTAAASSTDEAAAPEPTGEPGAPAQAKKDAAGGELWWLWAGIGAAVVGTVIAALIVTSSNDPVQPPMRGSVGGTIQTLEAR
jgi:tetratricopeptide (TPR) repeat protein